MNSCMKCGKETTNKKYCSRSCAVSVNNINKPKRVLRNCCKRCGVGIRSNVSYCKGCWAVEGKAKDITLGEAIYDKAHRSSAYALVRTRARAAVKDRVRSCANCGYDKHVEVCHIRAIRDFPLTSLLSEINEDSNLVLLCPNCHWEFDNGLLALSN